jgi:hypothetical protein
MKMTGLKEKRVIDISKHFAVIPFRMQFSPLEECPSALIAADTLRVMVLIIVKKTKKAKKDGRF